MADEEGWVVAYSLDGNPPWTALEFRGSKPSASTMSQYRSAHRSPQRVKMFTYAQWDEIEKQNEQAHRRYQAYKRMESSRF